METLFTTELQNGGKPTAYQVSFHEDAYHFKPNEGSADELIIKREHDEWHVAEGTDKEVSRAAIAALESYLLSQH